MTIDLSDPSYAKGTLFRLIYNGGLYSQFEVTGCHLTAPLNLLVDPAPSFDLLVSGPDVAFVFERYVFNDEAICGQAKYNLSGFESHYYFEWDQTP